MILELDWLPSILLLSGTWEEILSTLYSVFEEDFKKGKPYLDDYAIWWDQTIKADQTYEEGFYHIISIDNKKTGERIPEFRRAERLPWCAPLITHSDDNSVKIWDYEEGTGQIHTYIWLEEGDYCIVLKKLPTHSFKVAMLITAFYVDGPSRRRNLRTKLEKKLL